jgi:integrase
MKNMKHSLNEETLVSSPKIRAFLNKYTSANTKSNYKCSLIKFFQFIDRIPEEYLKDPRLLTNAKKIALLDGYEADIGDYWQQIQEPSAPRTIIMNISVVKSFFEDNHIEFERRFWKNLRIRGKGSNTIIEDINPQHEQIRTLINLADTKAKAFILAKSCSGMRINELCSIRMKDIDFVGVPVTVKIKSRMAKNKNNATTFFSAEAMTAINSWLKIRDDYLKKSIVITTHLSRTMPNGKIIRPKPKSVDDDRLFPMDTTTVRESIWAPLLKKAGLDQKDETGRYKFRPHSLRKFFITQMSKGAGGEAFAHQLANQKGYLSQYKEITNEEEKKRIYLQSEHLLAIEPCIEEVTRETQKQLKDQQEMIDMLVVKIETMEKRDAYNQMKSEQLAFEGSINKQFPPHSK